MSGAERAQTSAFVWWRGSDDNVLMNGTDAMH